MEWRDIPGLEGLYQASSEGRIRSLDRITFGRNRSTRLVKGKVLSLRVNPTSGYIQSVISVEGKVRYMYNHRLVCLAFHGLPLREDDDACHFDNDRKNNRPANLRWDTRKGNHSDKVRHGTNHNGKKLTMGDALEIRRLRTEGLKVQDIADKFRVSQSNVSMILRNVIWRADS